MILDAKGSNPSWSNLDPFSDVTTFVTCLQIKTLMGEKDLFTAGLSLGRIYWEQRRW